MQKIKFPQNSAATIEALLRSKEDYKIACRLVCILSLAKGDSSRKAQEMLLLSHNQILIWSKRFIEKGIEGLKDKPKTGRKSKISEKQLSWLKNLVINESPTKYGYNTETWTAPLIVEVLDKEWQLKYSDDMVYILLKKKLGLTHKKGKGFYPEASKEKRQVFVETLKKNLEAPKEDVFLFEDECSMSNTAVVSYKWSEKGKQPIVIQKQSHRERLTLFGSVNPTTGVVIVQKAEKGNAKNFKKYLKKVLYYYRTIKGKIHMILDNVRYHHAKALQPFLTKHKDKIELFFLPPYSPDFNPIERVWWYMRKKISNNRYIESLQERMKNFWKLFSHYQKPNDFIIKLCNLNYSV